MATCRILEKPFAEVKFRSVGCRSNFGAVHIWTSTKNFCLRHDRVKHSQGKLPPSRRGNVGRRHDCSACRSNPGKPCVCRTLHTTFVPLANLPNASFFELGRSSPLSIPAECTRSYIKLIQVLYYFRNATLAALSDM